MPKTALDSDGSGEKANDGSLDHASPPRTLEIDARFTHKINIKYKLM